jgi:hypothetical protein
MATIPKHAYYIETRNAKRVKKYSKPYATKEEAMARFNQLESQKKWGRLCEFKVMFMLITEQTSLALLEQTIVIRDSYKDNPIHQRGIDACNKHIAELREKLK